MTDSSSVEQRLAEAKSLMQRQRYRDAWVAVTDILKFDPNNSEAQGIKSELEESRKLMNVGSKSEHKVTSIRCTNCNSPLDITIADAEAATCSACGAVLDLESEDYKVLTQLNSGNYPPRSFIKLGMIGNFDNKECQVIGRICYDSHCKEWDAEDRQYYTEPWSYDEWILVTEDKTYLYLSEDKEGYYLSRPVIPTKPSIPKEDDTHLTLFKDINPQRIKEFTSSSIAYFEGEFTWTPRRGERSKSAEYVYGVQAHSVSWRLNPKDLSPVEVEFFKTENVSKRDLAVAFKRQDVIDEEDRKLAAEKEYKWWSNAFILAGIFCFLGMVGSCASDGNKVASRTVSLAQTGDEGILVGPFHLNQVGSVHQIKLSGGLPDNASAWGGVELLDESKAPINVVQNEFWRESGYDSDGHWSESDLSETVLFRLDNAGRYYVRVFGEATRSGKGSMTVGVYEGLSLSRYWIFSFLMCLGFAFAIRRYKSMNPIYVLIGVFALGWFILSNLEDD